jgi:hypothetical protein
VYFCARKPARHVSMFLQLKLHASPSQAAKYMKLLYLLRWSLRTCRRADARVVRNRIDIERGCAPQLLHSLVAVTPPHVCALRVFVVDFSHLDFLFWLFRFLVVELSDAVVQVSDIFPDFHAQLSSNVKVMRRKPECHSSAIPEITSHAVHTSDNRVGTRTFQTTDK